MMQGIVDTTVILHYFRKHPSARSWIEAQPQRLLISSITWLEVIEGTTSRSNLLASKQLLSLFDLTYLTQADQEWAMQKLEQFQFSHHIGLTDCLIAAIAYRLQVPLYTHNLKDMRPLLGQLAIQPY